MTRLLRYVLVALLACSAPAVLAQATPAPDTAADAAAPAPTAAQTLVQLRKHLDEIKAAVDIKNSDVPLSDLRSQALAVQQQAEQLASSLTPQSASLQTRLDVLGPAPVKGGPAESPELASQRRQLSRAQADLQGQIKQANSLGTEAAQLAAHVAELRRDQFQAQLASRTPTPFSRAFWLDPLRVFPGDFARVRALAADAFASVREAWQPPNRTPLLVCLIIAAALLVAGRWAIERALLRLTTHRMPAGPLRRSALALTVTLAYTIAMGLTAHFAYLALNWNGLFSDDVDALAHKLTRLVTFAAFVTGLGRAVLSCNRPSWRLPSLSDDLVMRLRSFPFLLGIAALLIGAVENLNSTIGASLATTVTTRALLAVLVGLLFGSALLRMGQSRRAVLATGGTPPQRPVWAGLLIGAAFVCVGISLLGVALGYIAFAFFIARQMLWFAVVLTALYVLLHLVDDIFHSAFAPKGRTGLRMQSSFGVAPVALEQTGTLLSGVTRAMLVILAVAFVLAPFGAGPQELAGRVGGLLSGASLGKLKIVPGAIFQAVLVFALGLIVLRVIKNWLSNQLLPKTTLDAGMQNSMVTLLGYVGGVLVFGLALADLGVDLQSIAWMASALSVGIGFGLQAIVQNFISGLILLAERPVKVGDWVSIGGVEGDVRRINVRATEIKMGDLSTMIVPNSQFITQNVRNVTLANAQGRAAIKLSMPLDTDADKARTLLLEVMRAHPGVLPAPVPSVQLDNLDGGSMTFSCTAYVSSPRDAGNVKSDLLFEMLHRLRAAKMPLTTPQSMVVRTLPPPVEDPQEQG